VYTVLSEVERDGLPNERDETMDTRSRNEIETEWNERQAEDFSEDFSEEITSESDVVELLTQFFDEASNGNSELHDALGDDRSGGLLGASAVDFGRAGLLTQNEGIVLRLRNGAEFQLTVVRR